MKLLFCTGHYYPHIGGVERYTRELAHRLGQRGHLCRILTNNTNQSPEREWIEGVEVFRLPAWNILGGQFPVAKPFFKTRELFKTIRDWRPDIIVTNTRYFFSNALVTFFSRREKIPHVHIDHGSNYVRLSNPVLNLFSRLYDRLVGGYVLRSADYRAGVSTAVNQFMAQSFHVQPDGVLPNAVEAKQIVLSGTNFRARLGIRADDQVFGFAGRLIPEKGVHILLEAHRLLGENGSARHLVIAGEGELAEHIHTASERNPSVHFLGRIAPGDMPTFFRTIDFFVFPSYYPEGFPTVVLEAASYGKWIITTERGGTRGLISSGQFGTIIQEQSVEALLKAFKLMILASPAERRAVGQRIRERVITMYSWEKTVEQFERIIGSFRQSL